MEENKLINVNVGVLGHVDSGKTSLCRALSTTASTAAFDSNPQSKERGITLDLGFSAFTLEDKWNVTLVDCPGHASLIRTVLGGVQIMDIMVLVIDATKGMEPQAAECLILASICCPNLIVVLNKVDLIEKYTKTDKLDNLRRRMCGTLAKTRFAGQPIVSVSATDDSIGTLELKTALAEKLLNIKLTRLHDSPFLMAIDHCFTIKGSGTICTGTILQGGVKIGDTIEFPELRISKKVKTLQMFRKPIVDASAGDRVALGIPGLDSKLVERGIISTPNLIKPDTKAAIIKIDRIQYYNRSILSKTKYHVTIGYSTVTSLVTIFGEHEESTALNLNQQYEHVPEIEGDKSPVMSSLRKHHFALLVFDRPICVLPNALVIGSNLQAVEDNSCRLAFSGKVLDANQEKDFEKSYLPNIKIFRWKTKKGTIDRIVSNTSVIVKGFCQRASKIDHLLGLKVDMILDTERGQNTREVVATGKIESRFGQTNKVKIALDTTLTEEASDNLTKNLRSTWVELNYKKFIFTDSNGAPLKLVQ